MVLDIDPSKCPLCGESNACAMADSNEGEPEKCWCMSEKFPDELLKKVPLEAQQCACICLKCLRSYASN